ncbi:MAG: ThuA domain-containing protein [Bacteroidetes bacterium]|nr:ThuA domain-containing protein [Bacteroidota bacterium]MDA1121938.1 ThuA domain-containing protein [Bacteroidota bacterium]
MKNTIVILIVGMTLASLFSFSRQVQSEKRLLVYTKNGEGYVHDNIAKSIEMIKGKATSIGFVVDVSNDPQVMNEGNLKRYDALVFSNTNNEAFDTDKQKLAFQRYIQAGGRLVTIHSACGSERQWPWFWKNVGGTFYRHAPGGQTFDIKRIDSDNPSTSHLPDVWAWEDECYYLKHLNPDINVLLAADLRTVEDEQKDEYPGQVFGNYFPISWCHEFDGGRQWHTSLGHKIEYYDNPAFQNHILGGIKWVTQEELKLDYSKVATQLILD